jgi:hypothetical protein
VQRVRRGPVGRVDHDLGHVVEQLVQAGPAEDPDVGEVGVGDVECHGCQLDAEPAALPDEEVDDEDEEEELSDELVEDESLVEDDEPDPDESDEPLDEDDEPDPDEPDFDEPRLSFL